MDKVAKRGKVQVGDRAPDFTLSSQDGKKFHLGELLGKKSVVLYFYPKDETLGCTKEACAFRDRYEVFTDAGAEVIGVSADSIETHQRFASNQRLPFLLLSDSSGELRKLYGVPTTFGLLPGRVTYIIDKQGIVRHIFSAQFAPERHIEESLKIIQAL